MPRRVRPILAVVLAAALVTPAAALTRRELVCQAAIARVGRVYVQRELAQRARCWIAAVQGRPCEDEDDASERNAKYVGRALRRCRGVTLARLGGGGCVARSADVDSLRDCIVATHDDAVAGLIEAQFGLADLTPRRAACAVGRPSVRHGIDADRTGPAGTAARHLRRTGGVAGTRAAQGRPSRPKEVP
jgi:hypothetical protein